VPYLWALVVISEHRANCKLSIAPGTGKLLTLEVPHIEPQETELSYSSRLILKL
jgi:hypothetical protein